ncbi:hypothetical protein [Duganella radicis]|uniref:Uncharacterized protein n=1 Tax=Duganella radicis TaxID=551988 RepID=A0A6L6PJR8_9BURK|nr:hypothetical protein [Duganella radicis]MTV38827.1 hypothetical protein [Duganella radicis]
MKKRNLFNELMEGFAAIEAARRGEMQIKKIRVELNPPSAVQAKVLPNPPRKKNRVH